MLKKMLVIAAILVMAGTVFGGWSANKFGNLPPTKIPDPCDPGKQIDNPEWLALQDAAMTGGKAFDRSVDWESDGNSTQRKGESWAWPASYDFVPICDIRVQMDVGFWIKIVGCRDNIIKLKQRMINQYGGSTTCDVYTNVATEWKASFVKKDGIDLGKYDKSAKVDPSTFPSTKGDKQVITISLKMWDVNLANLPAGTNCLDIGWVRVQVRPTVRPNVFINNACGGKYPTYAPPTTDGKGYDKDVVWW